MIWIVHPETQDVQAYRGDRHWVLQKVGESLEGGDVLPGFRCPVADLFE